MEKYKFNPVTKTLTVTSAFEKAMNQIDSEEYRLYVKLRRDIPGLTVSLRTHRTPSKYHSKSGEVFRCNQFKNLTYENMERFIAALPQQAELMAIYNYIRYGAGLVQTSCYTAVRRWFAAQFPNFRKDPLFYYKRKITVITDIEPFIRAAQEESQNLETAA